MKLVKISKDNIKLLNDAMDLIYEEWGESFSSPKETKLKKIRKEILEEKRFPQIYLVQDKNQNVGSFSILEYELKDSNLSPWLACVVISKKYRGKGYGNTLLSHMKKVIEESYNVIYLTTEHIGFYEKIGFKLVKIIDNNGKNNRLYCKRKD